jgi:hypothetical protein
MHLHISSKQPISDIQKIFSSTFPYLKIEFFRRPATQYPSPADHRITETREQVMEDGIEITGEMKVRELEQALDRLFSLDARVFRRSGNIWLETTMTNGWTLAHQNEQGREISMPDGKGGDPVSGGISKAGC